MEGQKGVEGCLRFSVSAPRGAGITSCCCIWRAGVGRLASSILDVVGHQQPATPGDSRAPGWGGQNQIESAKHRIAEINPTDKVDLLRKPPSPSDNALGRSLPPTTSSATARQFPPLSGQRRMRADGQSNVYGSIFSLRGSGPVWCQNYQKGPTTATCSPNRRRRALVPSCAEGGVVGCCRHHRHVQATETVKLHHRASAPP